MLVAAAFGRLCVETNDREIKEIMMSAAAFGRLCVETPIMRPNSPHRRQPPP